jgi:hypothetical protein
MMKNKTKKKSLRMLKIKKMKHQLSRQHKFPKRGNQKKNYRNEFILTQKRTGMKNMRFIVAYYFIRASNQPEFLAFFDRTTRIVERLLHDPNADSKVSSSISFLIFHFVFSIFSPTTLAR